LVIVETKLKGFLRRSAKDTHILNAVNQVHDIPFLYGKNFPLATASVTPLALILARLVIERLIRVSRIPILGMTEFSLLGLFRIQCGAFVAGRSHCLCHVSLPQYDVYQDRKADA
jgi:hypothetical protein